MSLAYLHPYREHIRLDWLENVQRERSLWNDLPNVRSITHQVKSLPEIRTNHFEINGPWVEIGQRSEITDNTFTAIYSVAKALIPWRKGPFRLFGLEIDAEWRSDYKWDRIATQLPSLHNQKVLDIGCNNGYYMFRIAKSKPEFVMGIDPTPRIYQQFLFLNRFVQIPNMEFELFGYEHLPAFRELFDVIFSMGIIYHCRNPVQHLQDIHDALAPGGSVVLESISYPSMEECAIVPAERYAQMRNVWFVPTEKCLVNWLRRVHFQNVEVVSHSKLTMDEQRLTEWCPPPHQSLEQFLDPNDSTKTVEGYPAPTRVCLIARKKK